MVKAKSFTFANIVCLHFRFLLYNSTWQKASQLIFCCWLWLGFAVMFLFLKNHPNKIIVVRGAGMTAERLKVLICRRVLMLSTSVKTLNNVSLILIFCRNKKKIQCLFGNEQGFSASCRDFLQLLRKGWVSFSYLERKYILVSHFRKKIKKILKKS